MEPELLFQCFEPIMDPSGEAYIQACTEGAVKPIQLPLESLPARCLIKGELFRMLGGVLPTDHQTRSCMDVLWAWAFHGNRTVAELSLEYLLTYDPVAQAIMALHRKGGAKQSAKPLLSILARIAKMEGIDITKGNWPVNEDALGCRLRAFIGPFAIGGISITYTDRTRPRTWCIPPRLRPSGVSGSKVSDANVDPQSSSTSRDTSDPLSGTSPGEVTLPNAEGATEPEWSQMQKPPIVAADLSELGHACSHSVPGSIDHDQDHEERDVLSDEQISELWEATQ